MPNNVSVQGQSVPPELRGFVEEGEYPAYLASHPAEAAKAAKDAEYQKSLQQTTKTNSDPAGQASKGGGRNVSHVETDSTHSQEIEKELKKVHAKSEKPYFHGLAKSLRETGARDFLAKEDTNFKEQVKFLESVSRVFTNTMNSIGDFAREIYNHPASWGTIPRVFGILLGLLFAAFSFLVIMITALVARVTVAIWGK
jgi:hypothetical protein